MSRREDHLIAGFFSGVGARERLRNLPAVDAVLNTGAAKGLLERFGRAAFKDAIRSALQDARATLQAGGYLVPTAEQIATESLAYL